MAKKDDAQDKAIASEPGERVKDWVEDEEGKDFDDELRTPKTMAEEPPPKSPDT